MSRYHQDHPYSLRLDGIEHRVDYEPAESSSALFGGNSNWRGPVWFPVNYLLIESLQKFHRFYGDDVQGRVSDGLGDDRSTSGRSPRSCRGGSRASSCATRTGGGRSTAARRCSSAIRTGATSSSFYEYFHGDNGAGIGASHQTGWTGLVAKLLQQSGER